MAHGSPIVGTPGTSIAAQCGSAATGTQVNSADLNDALTSIENDIASLAAGLLSPYSPGRYVAAPWGIVDHTTKAVSYSDDGSSVIVSVTVSDWAVVWLAVPHGQKITNITVNIYPGVRANLPATMPILELAEMNDNPLNGTTNVHAVWSATDSSPDAATYSTLHAISLSPVGGVTPDRHSYRYRLRVYGEASTNANVFSLGPAKVTFAITGSDPSMIG